VDHEEPAGRPILLERDFEAHLLEQLTQQALHEPLCWYEVSDAQLLLRTGGCNYPVNFTFARFLPTGPWLASRSSLAINA
jgi:hypothetical protein